MKILFILLALMTLNVSISQEWQFVEDLAPVESNESDFGTNMVFAGDKLVISWPRIFTRGNSADNCGEVITYEKVNGNFQEVARLTAQDLVGSCVDGDGFGFGLAYDNGRLAIGMPAGARAGIGTDGGATDADSRVFLTTFENGNWALQETLIASDLNNGSGMGLQLVLEGDVLLIHAHEYDSIFGFSFIISTGVYVFEDSGSGFSEVQKLEENFHLFGQDFDYENDQIIVGAWGEQAINQPGRIYIYEKMGVNWQNIQTINDNRNANLGNQIAIVGNTMAAGNVQAGGVGAATIFSKDNNGQWSEIQFIQASDSAFNDQFGIGLMMSENELIVGATAGQDQVQTLGAVYTYTKGADGQFIEQQKLVATNPTDLYDRFGGNMIFNGTDLLINSASGGFANADVTTFHHFSRESNGGETSYPVDSKISGVWSAGQDSNQKISIELLDNNRAVMFAGLNNNNQSFWLLGVGNVQNNTIDFTELFTTNGGRFGLDFDPTEVINENIGQAMISFNRCNQATLTYDLPSIESSEVNLSKDIEIPGNECDAANKDLPNGVSGAWFNSNRNGEGLTNYVFDSNGIQMATLTWYTYDNNGQQMWLTGTGTITDQTLNISEMKKFMGADLFTGQSQATIVGSLSMNWNVCHIAELTYDFTSTDLGTGSIDLTQLTRLDNTQCVLNK